MTTRTRTLLNRMYAHNALRQSHGLSRERLTLIELATMINCSLQQTRSCYRTLNRRCEANAVLVKGIAHYALTAAGRERAKAPETKRERSRRGAPYVPREKNPEAKPATFEPLIPTELVKRVPRSIFDWIP